MTLLRRDTDAPASVGARPPARPPAACAAPGRCVASVGDDPCLRPEDGDTEVPVGDDLILVLRGRTLAAEDQRVLAAFATQVAVAYQQRQLAEAAEAAVAAGRDRPDAHRAAQRRQPRPAHPDRVGQGGGVQPAQRRGRPGASRTSRSCSPTPTTRWTGSPRWSPTCSTCPGCRPACCRSRVAPVGLDDVVSRALDHAAPRRADRAGRARDAAGGAGRRRPARAGDRQPGRERACATAPPTARPDRREHPRRARRAAGHRPRARHRAGRPRDRLRAFQRRDDHATSTAPASGSGWPSPADSSKRCTARSPSTTPPAAG